jgi:phage shock protein PspC (stress-responsive transcriptional regulator)
MTDAGSILTREDTLFGVCFALGQDFRFNPTHLRILFALGLFWSLPGALAAYAGFGLLVALSRLIAPDPKPAEEVAEVLAGCADEPCEALRLAA